MKYIYSNTLSSLTYNIYVNGVLTNADSNVSVTVNDVSLGNATTSSTGKYSKALPSTYNAENGELEVVWLFSLSSNSYTVKECYQVITPYVTWDEVYEKFTSYGKTYQDYLEAESLVRNIIDVYCGQKFMKFEAQLEAEGTGLDGLVLPNRLISLDDVQWYEELNVIYVDEDTPWEIAADGWILRKQLHYDKFDPTSPGRDKFRRNRIYFVSGVWGYECVPEEIHEAAGVLIEDYICPDQNYRNKYLDNIRSGEWRLEYNQLAFIGTGNAVADQLLNSHRRFPEFGVI